MTTAIDTRNTQWEAAVIISMTQCVTISMTQCVYASVHVLLFLCLNFLTQCVYASMCVLLFLCLNECVIIFMTQGVIIFIIMQVSGPTWH